MINDKILMLRKEQNISQLKLAEELYVSRQTISRWESGKSLPTMENIIQLANYFEKETSFFISDYINEESKDIKLEKSEIMLFSFIKNYWKDICTFLIATSPLIYIWFTPLSYISLIYSIKQKKKYTFIIGLIVLSFTMYFLLDLIVMLITLLGIGGTTTEVFME